MRRVLALLATLGITRPEEVSPVAQKSTAAQPTFCPKPQEGYFQPTLFQHKDAVCMLPTPMDSKKEGWEDWSGINQFNITHSFMSDEMKRLYDEALSETVGDPDLQSYLLNLRQGLEQVSLGTGKIKNNLVFADGKPFIETLLHYAIKRGYSKTTDFLIKKGGLDLDQKDTKTRTAASVSYG